MAALASLSIARLGVSTVCRRLLPGTLNGSPTITNQMYNGAGPATWQYTDQCRYVSMKTRKKRAPNRKVRLYVMLNEDVDGLGLKGDAVAVKRGYARNFLIPQKLASYMNQQLAQGHDQLEASMDAEEQKLAQEALMSSKVAKFIANKTITLKRQEGNKWEVTPEMLVQKVKKQINVEVPEQRIHIGSPITTYGRHEVPVMVDDNTPSQLNIEIVRR
eukprot:m.41361 g.41361  ORF g.41361 m.41361 type:complete len:217 (+) comp14914_c0_seq1:114-764(+)